MLKDAKNKYSVSREALAKPRYLEKALDNSSQPGVVEAFYNFPGMNVVILENFCIIYCLTNIYQQGENYLTKVNLEGHGRESTGNGNPNAIPRRCCDCQAGEHSLNLCFRPQHWTSTLQSTDFNMNFISVPPSFAFAPISRYRTLVWSLYRCKNRNTEELPMRGPVTLEPG